MNQISAEYHKRAQSFLKVNADMVEIIHAKPEPSDAKRENEIKVAWFTYFSVKGMEGTIKTFQFILNGGGKALTFPCANPEHFDGSYVAPRHRWHDPNDEPVDNQRGDVSRLVANTLSSLRAAIPRGQKRQDNRQRQPEQSPQDWLDAYQSDPPPIPVFSDGFKTRARL